MKIVKEPLYIQVQNHYKELIRSRQLNEGDKIPTEKEILKEFKISRITLVNAFSELVREGWIHRIPGRGTYVKGIPKLPISEELSLPAPEIENSIRSFRPKIGLVFPFAGDYFAIRLIQGITSVLDNSGYSLLIMFSFNSKEQEKEIIRDMKTKVEALIIFPVDGDFYNEEIIALKMQQYPFVLIDRYLPGVATNAVYSDSALATKLAVDHLWSLGHRDIAICSDSLVAAVSVDDRINGYMKALSDHGAMINPALQLVNFNASVDDSENKLLSCIKNRMATAYIVLNSKLGFKLWSIANRAGLKVPEDLSIITFDDPSPMMGDMGLFTHINQSEMDIGIKAGELIIEVLKGKRHSKQSKRIVIKPTLVVKKSTASMMK
jgi:GntR family transcriptional regulator of arabinose operon